LNDSISSLENFVKANIDLFEVGNREVLNEISIFKEDKEYRIDRLVIDSEKKHMEIIDYKTGREKDPKQLEVYKEVLEEKYVGYTVETRFVKVEL
jgi:hypothetical protein